jgi:hypothetical protein
MMRMNNIFLRIGLLVILLTTLFFSGGCTLDSGGGARFEPSIALSEVNGLSDTEVVNRLYSAYLDHFKAKPFYDNFKLTDYKDIHARKLKNHINGYEGDLFYVNFAVKQGLFAYWDVNTRGIKDGWIHGGYYVELTKANGKAKLRVLGTGL